MAALSSGTVKFLEPRQHEFKSGLNLILTYSLLNRNILGLMYPLQMKL
jgi:hypothetical protein